MKVTYVKASTFVVRVIKLLPNQKILILLTSKKLPRTMGRFLPSVHYYRNFLDIHINGSSFLYWKLIEKKENLLQKFY